MSFTILGQKDVARPPRPLILATIVAVDGDTCYLSTAASLGQAYLDYGGNHYQSRLLDQNIDAIQAMSTAGIDIPPRMSLKIADADAAIWTNHSNPHGWRGAAVTLTFILWDVVANAYSTDAMTWGFIGGSPSWADGVMTMDCTSRSNMQRLKMPSIPIQRRCPWSFPATSGQRSDALNTISSIYYQCGYSADQGGGCGNTTTANLINPDGSVKTDGAGNYVMCDYTRAACMDRLGNASATSVAPDGDITHDQAGHPTGRFGGITWTAPPSYQGRQYTTGQWVFGFNTPNSGIYGGYWNTVYGEQWVNATVVNTAGSANILQGEAVICEALYGQATAIMVNVNNVTVPNLNTSDPNFSWQYINQGGRNGALNPSVIWNRHGDPYGSLCAIQFTVPFELAAPGSVPTVQVLVYAPPILTYELVSGTPTPFYVQGCRSPVWQLLDLLQWANYSLSEIDPANFIAAADFCATNIPYLDLNGASSVHSRFLSSFALTGDKRATLASIVQALRQNCGMILAPNSATGLMQIFIEQTLVEQQGAPVAGSNTSTPIASEYADSTIAVPHTGNGYSAYDFTEADIQDFKLTTRSIADTPNSFSVQFQDEANQFQVDSVTMTDPDGYIASGNQEVSDPTQTLGISNFDQAARRGNTILSRDLRGNARDDAGGTEYFEFTTTMKAVHLASRPGYICGLSYQQLGL
jgi:hypothetical protein